MMKTLLAASGLGLLAVPVIAVLAALNVGGPAVACIESSAGGALSQAAPVPAAARVWVGETKAACPDLPETWIAAVMAQESGFRPDAHAEDANGGTWGLFQLNASIWRATYGHPWSADLNNNGTWDVNDPDIHARVAGQYLCNRLNTVRSIRATHPDWASSRLPVLDALIIAHNAGESRLATYPAMPDVTARFITAVDQRVAAWSVPDQAGAQSEPLGPVATTGPTASPATDPRPSPSAAGRGCLPGLGTSGDVVVPPGTPAGTVAAVQTAMSYVGARSGWAGLCDKLACRAYGYTNSGYTSAAAHWDAMLLTGHAHPGNTCPPLGSFVFWATGRPFGHTSIVVQADLGCDPAKTLVTSNEVFDSATGNHGGVYLISLAQINAGFVHGAGYLGWSDPICRGALQAPGATPPTPSGR
jgi:transglycosylase-like protein with SLT domain